MPGLLVVVSGKKTPLTLNLALSKLPLVVVPATQKFILSPVLKLERLAFGIKTQLSVYALTSEHEAVGGAGGQTQVQQGTSPGPQVMLAGGASPQSARHTASPPQSQLHSPPGGVVGVGVVVHLSWVMVQFASYSLVKPLQQTSPCSKQPPSVIHPVPPDDSQEPLLGGHGLPAPSQYSSVRQSVSPQQDDPANTDESVKNMNNTRTIVVKIAEKNIR